ncbi:hypothetical protein QYE76_034002 [Lolium multiflorum]|uniref:Transposase (putative) gypsy type domain-containing protein n=1 Tax=Lolium multiflorum TaxID=4521 RepID=A0AAD8QYQ9_LOLMU|nr:hypothetical protein QYE76_034002 [Lolium multiflorum]
MPPRARLTRHTTPEASMATQDLEISEWERSKISNQDTNLLKKLGLMKKEEVLIFPSEESFPTPPIQYRVTFVDHLIRGFSAPIHEFLRGLLFVYGLQLHQLTPNSILHISIFITLCECFLGTHPNWALWKRIFCIRRNSSHNIAYNIGGVVIRVRPDVDYFDVEFPDSVQGWRRRWLYVREEYSDSQEYNIAPFDGSAKILRRRSWDAEATEEEKTATDALMKRIHELQNTRGKELSGIQITAHFLRIRVQPLQARKNPLWLNPSKEIFSELDEINARVLFFHEASEDRRGYEVGDEVPIQQGSAAQVLAARPWRVGPSWRPLTYPSAYLKSSSRKPQYREPRYGKPSGDAAAANPISGIQEIASGTLPEGNHLPGGLFIAMSASGSMCE